jgi:DNA-binding transcriptional ArsR family regulator
MDIRNDSHTMPEPADLKPLFRMHAELCKALASPHRLGILYALSQQEMCVSDLATALEIPVHNVSQHLRVLRDQMLVRPRKDGQTVYYSMTNPKFIQGCTLIRQALIEQHRELGESLLAPGVLEAIQHLPVPSTP